MEVLVYNGMQIKSGDLVEGSIEGLKVKGKINIVGNNKYYFCQDKKDGSRTSNTMGYNYSWEFSFYEGRLSEGVKIFKNLSGNKKRSSTKTVEKITIEPITTSVNNYYEVNKITYLKHFSMKHGYFPNKIIKTINLFKLKAHPDCCGSHLLYNFDSSGEISYSQYKDLKPKDYKEIVKILRNHNLAAKMIHLSHRQTVAIKFVEKLGFKKQFEYVNNNSGNTILVYHKNEVE